jgi:hypothetical protein
LVRWDIDGKSYLRYDIRPWSSDHSEYGKGLGLSEEEFGALVDLVIGHFSKKKPSDFHLSKNLLD